MSGVFDELRASEPKHPPKVGYVWLMMLIKYDYSTGKSEIVKSFSKPAKESNIKKSKKKKPTSYKVNNIDESRIKIPDIKNIDKTVEDEVELF